MPLQVLDDCLFDGEADSAYRAKREATVLIGVDCTPDEHCFCTSMGTDRAASGFDLFLHRVDGDYLVQTGSERGEALLARHAPATAALPGEPPLPLQVKQCSRSLQFPAESLAPLLEQVYDHPLWKEIGDLCLGCGACTLLCPSCYCFNVQDRLDLNLQGGERMRTWDSCQFDQFTRVSGGGDFRADQADRQRHRFFRKYKYLWEKHQRTACVGCGRCSRECLSGIDAPTVLNRLFAGQPDPAEMAVPGAEYRPQLAEIVAVEQLTDREKLFRLRLPQALAFAPGTFMEVSVFGLGEAPFTIASALHEDRQIDIVVRAAGALTQALHRLQAGDTVGVRGPFGSGFPLDRFLGRDILLVAGGLGLITLRSLLLTILDRRGEFGRVTLLYGARDVPQLLFRKDLLAWHQGGEIDCRFVVGNPQNGWGLASRRHHLSVQGSRHRPGAHGGCRFRPGRHVPLHQSPAFPSRLRRGEPFPQPRAAHEMRPGQMRQMPDQRHLRLRMRADFPLQPDQAPAGGDRAMKPRIGFFDFTGCEGCQMTVLNLEDRFLDLLELVEIVEFRAAFSGPPETLDIAFVEGSICRPEEAARLRDIRARSRLLVALGACADTAGVNALVRCRDPRELRREVYGGEAPHLLTEAPAAAFGGGRRRPPAARLPDRRRGIPGRPAGPAGGTRSRTARLRRLRRVQAGRTPLHLRGGDCLSRAGHPGRLRRPLPAGGDRCRGCRGQIDNPRSGPYYRILEENGLTEEDILQELRTFNLLGRGER